MATQPLTKRRDDNATGAMTPGAPANSGADSPEPSAANASNSDKLITIHDSTMPLDTSEQQVVQLKLPPNLATFVRGLEQPFTINIPKVDCRNLSLEIMRLWPRDLGITRETQQFATLVANMVRDMPVLGPDPTVLFRMSFALEPPSRIDVPQPMESALLASVDAESGVLSSFIVPATPDMPNAAELAVKKGFLIMSQHLLPWFNPVGDNRGQGMGPDSATISSEGRQKDSLAMQNAPRENYMGGTAFDAIMNAASGSNPNVIIGNIHVLRELNPAFQKGMGAIVENAEEGDEDRYELYGSDEDAGTGGAELAELAGVAEVAHLAHEHMEHAPAGERREHATNLHHLQGEGHRAEDIAHRQHLLNERLEAEKAALERRQEGERQANEYAELKQQTAENAALTAEALAAAAEAGLTAAEQRNEATAEALAETFKGNAEALAKTNELNAEALAKINDLNAEALAEAGIVEAGPEIAPEAIGAESVGEEIAVAEAPAAGETAAFEAAASEEAEPERQESAQAENSLGSGAEPEPAAEPAAENNDTAERDEPAHVEIEHEEPHNGPHEALEEQRDEHKSFEPQEDEANAAEEPKSHDAAEQLHTTEEVLHGEEAEEGEIGTTEFAEADAAEQADAPSAEDHAAYAHGAAPHGGFAHEAALHAGVHHVAGDVAEAGAGAYAASHVAGGVHIVNPAPAAAGAGVAANLNHPAAGAGAAYHAAAAQSASASVAEPVIVASAAAKAAASAPVFGVAPAAANMNTAFYAMRATPAATSSATLGPLAAGVAGFSRRPFASMQVGGFRPRPAGGGRKPGTSPRKTAAPRQAPKQAPKPQNNPPPLQAKLGAAMVKAVSAAAVPQHPPGDMPTLDMG